jgi:hypothetical protein
LFFRRVLADSIMETAKRCEKQSIHPVNEFGTGAN